MYILATFFLVFSALLLSVKTGVPLVYPLVLGLGCFCLISIRQGFGAADLVAMMLQGSRKSLIVIKILLLVGAITAVWRACGTVSFIVYYGMALLNPQYFILSAFLLCCLVSFLLGTAFGTVGTMGVVLIVLAKSGNVDINVAAGAIIAGSYFGDRCSPMSSSAALVAALTETELYANIKNMFKSSVFPLALSLAGYGLLSQWHPLTFHDEGIRTEIVRFFDIGMITLVPALIILIAAACRLDVKLSMTVSIFAGLLIGVFVQHRTVAEMIGYILTGYSMEGTGFLPGVIKGGGLFSMLNVGLIVLVSSAYSGIFEGTGLLHDLEGYVERINQRIGIYRTTILTGAASAAFGCNQTIAVILSYQFGRKLYKDGRLSKYRQALDLENTVILISALIPWNIAGAFPAAALSADAGFIVYAYYLFLVPLTGLFFRNTESMDG